MPVAPFQMNLHGVSAEAIGLFALGVWRNPFVASLIGYTMLALVAWVASRSKKSADAGLDRRVIPRFTGVGFCNGAGLFLTR